METFLSSQVFLEYLFYMIYVFVRNEPKVSFLFFIQLGVVLSFRIVELYIIISTNEWREKATKAQKIDPLPL